MVKVLDNTEFGTPGNIEECRAADIGIANFAECLRPGPNTCCYALPFGYCFLCQHPRLNEILKNTEQTQPGRATA